MEFLCDCGAVYWTIKDRLWIASRHARLASMHMHAFCVLSKYVWHEQCNTHLLNNTHKLQLVWNADSLIAFSFVHQCLCISLAANDQWLKRCTQMRGSMTDTNFFWAKKYIWKSYTVFAILQDNKSEMKFMYTVQHDQSIMSLSSMPQSWLMQPGKPIPGPPSAHNKYCHMRIAKTVYLPGALQGRLHKYCQAITSWAKSGAKIGNFKLCRLCCVISSSHFLTASLSAATDHWLLNWYTNIDVQNWMQSSYQHFTQVVIYECYSTSVCCIVHVIHTWTIHKRHAYAC